MKRFVIVAICILMAASVALAEKPAIDAKRCEVKIGHGYVDRDYDEGFEISVPPPGWTAVVTDTNDPTYTWYQDSYNPLEGTYYADCLYDYDLDPQDEWLYFDHVLQAGETHLNFGAMASYYYAVSPYQNYNTYVTVDGKIVWDFFTDHATDTSYEWKIYDVTLNQSEGDTITVGFGYVGVDGAEAAFDRVGLNGGYTPPPPPPNDVCEDALPLPNGDFELDVDTSLANDDYDPGYGGCTGYSAAGTDLVWYTDLDAGQTITVLMYADFDDSIYLVTDCADVVNSCVAGDDAYPDGSTFTYTATVADRYYLIVDGYSGSGTATVTGSNEGNVTAVEDASWTSIKALYR